jgi:hypothetical protein
LGISLAGSLGYLQSRGASRDISINSHNVLEQSVMEATAASIIGGTEVL